MSQTTPDANTGVGAATGRCSSTQNRLTGRMGRGWMEETGALTDRAGEHSVNTAVVPRRKNFPTYAGVDMSAGWAMAGLTRVGHDCVARGGTRANG